MPNPIAIKEVVENIIQGLGVGKKDTKEEIVWALSAAFDKKTLRHIKVERYQNQKLTINVDSSGWLYKLQLEKTPIQNKLSSLLPSAGIKEVVFKLGRI